MLRRSWPLLAALLLAAAPGCNKDKQASTTPAAAGGGGGAAGGVSGGGDLAGGGGDVAGGGDGSGDLGGGGGGDAAGADGAPAIRPPGVDLSPAEQQQQVALHLRQGRSAMAAKNQDPDLAIREASAALQADETSVDAMVLLAHGNFAKGYLDMAEDILGKALARGGSTNKQAHFLMGLILDRTDRLDKAMRQYEAAVAIDPNYSSAVMNLGVHYLRNKRYSDALTLYQRLTGELGYSSPAAFTNLGSALRGHSADFNTTDIAKRNDLLLKAEQAYKRAVSVKKDYGNAYYNLGLLYLDADPFPAGNGDMDRLKRLTQAKTYFDEYRRLPGADQTLADEQVGVAQKLIDREEKLRKKAADRAARDAAKAAAAKKKAEEAAKKGKKPTDDDEGFQ